MTPSRLLPLYRLRFFLEAIFPAFRDATHGLWALAGWKRRAAMVGVGAGGLVLLAGMGLAGHWVLHFWPTFFFLTHEASIARGYPWATPVITGMMTLAILVSLGLLLRAAWHVFSATFDHHLTLFSLFLHLKKHANETRALQGALETGLPAAQRQTLRRRL
jgi:hypothetical protein